MRRREVIVAAGAVAVTGCLGGGGYNVEAVKSEAEAVPYDEMSEGDRIHVERGRVSQVQTDGETYIVSTSQEEGEWVNSIFGSWDGESFEEGDEVELWGVVEGQIEADGETIPEVTIVDMQSAG